MWNDSCEKQFFYSQLLCWRELCLFKLKLLLPLLQTRPVRRQSQTLPRARKLTAQQQFVLDVVQSAVGRMIPAPQDRLRVLATAISVVNPVSPKLAKQYAAEGVRLEGQMIGSGEVPSASMMETGLVDCRTATEFVDQLPAPKVTDAEQSIIGAVNICPQAVQAAQAKLDVGASQGQVAPRAFMATAQHAGMKSPWSQSRFEKLMAALPDPKSAVKEAPNFAAMYSTMAPQVDKAVAQKSGISLLDWLAKLNDVPERNLAIRITTDGMKKALGADAYEEALRNDVVAQQTSRLTGSMELARPEEENVSVLQAMSQKGQDQTEAIKGMPSTLRAKEAAAAGFAEGTSGNKVQSAKYFDIAFSALDESWQSHPKGRISPAQSKRSVRQPRK